MGKEKSKVVELREKLSQLEKDLAKEKIHEPSATQQLDGELKKTLEEIGLLEAEDRKLKRAKFEPRVKELLVKLRDDRLNESERFELLKEACKATLAIRKLLGMRTAWDRIDIIKCLVVDETWRSRKLPQISQSIITSMGKKSNESLATNPIYSKEPVYENFPYKKAAQLAKEGKVEIVDGNQAPQFEPRYVYDEEPEVLKTLYSIDLGRPIEIEGKLSPELQAIRKDDSSFSFNLDSIIKLVSEKEVEAYAKKFE